MYRIFMANVQENTENKGGCSNIPFFSEETQWNLVKIYVSHNPGVYYENIVWSMLKWIQEHRKTITTSTWNTP